MLLIMFEPQPKLGVPDRPYSKDFRNTRWDYLRTGEKMMLLARVLLAVLSLSATSAIAMADDAPDYRANLSGTTVPMTVNTQARGEALFWISEDRQSVRYRLSVSEMENVTMAQLHLGKADTSGPVLVWLYPERPPPKLVRGMFTGVWLKDLLRLTTCWGRFRVDCWEN